MRSVMLLFLVTMMSFAQSDDVITADNIDQLHTIARRQFAIDEALPNALVWSSDSALLTLAFPTGLQIFDWKHSLETPMHTFAEGQDFRCLAWAGYMLAASCIENQPTVLLFDLVSGFYKLLEVGDPSVPHRIVEVALSPDGTRLAVANELSEAVYVWDISDTSTIPEPVILQETNFYPKDLAFSPDSKGLVVAFHYQKVVLWDMETYQPRWTTTSYTNSYRIAFNPNGEEIAIIARIGLDAEGNSLVTLDAERGRKRSGLSDYRGLDIITYHPSGDLVLIKEDFHLGRFYILDAHNWALLHEYEIGNAPQENRVAFSPDGRWLATFNQMNGLRIAGVSTEIVFVPPVTDLVAPGRARVIVPEGERLLARRYPDLNDPVIYEFFPGEILTVREGPVEMDGFTWWYVENHMLKYGWVIEEMDGVPNLIGTE